MQLVEPQNCAEAYNIRRGDKGSILVFGNHSLWLIPTDIGEICKNKERKREVKMARAWIRVSARQSRAGRAGMADLRGQK